MIRLHRLCWKGSRLPNTKCQQLGPTHIPILPLTSNTTRAVNTSINHSKAAVPSLFGTRDWFHGRQFFYGPGSGVGSGGNASDGEDGQRQMKLACLLLTSCCAARFLTGHGPVPVHSQHSLRKIIRMLVICQFLFKHAFPAFAFLGPVLGLKPQN